MKKNLLFLLLLFFQCSFAQLTDTMVALVDENKNGHLIVFHCSRSVDDPKEILIIVDGIPILGNGLREIDPNEILSITILKDAEAQALYGSRGINGVIIIETKRSGPLQFVVKDLIDGHPIPLATVSLISKEHKNIFSAKTNDTGFISFKYAGWDEIIVSAIGYKNDTIKNFAAFSNREILLKRDYKNCNEVVVVSQGATRCIHCSSCCFRIIRSTTAAAQETTGLVNLKIYPDPVNRGQPFNIEFQGQQIANVVIRMVAADGKIIFQKEVKVEEGFQHLAISTESKWAAGSYFIQLISNKEKPILQKQIVIQ